MSQDDKEIKNEKISMGDLIFIVITVGFLIALILGFTVFKLSTVVIANENAVGENSMSPTYARGDLFVIQKVPGDQINVGDIIVYKTSTFSTPIIHRVVYKISISVNGEIRHYFKTKGDNYKTNYLPDDLLFGEEVPGWISEDMIVGKVISWIPRVGLLSLWFNDIDPNTGKPYPYRIFIRNVLFVLAVIGLIFTFYQPKWLRSLFKRGIIPNAIKRKWKTFKEWMNEKVFSISFVRKPLNFIRKNKKWILLSVIVLLFVSGVIYKSTYYSGVDTGIRNLYVNMKTTFYDEMTNQNITFYQVVVELGHDGKWYDYLKEVYLDLYVNDVLVSRTRWNIFYQFSGIYRIGMAAFLPHSVIENITGDISIKFKAWGYISYFINLGGSILVEKTLSYDLAVL